MAAIKKVKCPKGHYVIVVDYYPEDYTKLTCEIRFRSEV